MNVKMWIADGNIIELRNGTRLLNVADRLLTWDNIVHGGGYADLSFDYECNGRSLIKGVEDIVTVYKITELYSKSLEELLTTKTTDGLEVKGWYNRSLVHPSVIDWTKVPEGTLLLTDDYIGNLVQIHNDTDDHVNVGEFLGYFPTSASKDNIAVRNSMGNIVGFRYATIHPLVEFDVAWLKEE